MLEINKNIDQVFRDKLSDFGQTPPSFVWENIQESLIQQKRERLYALFRGIGIAATVVLAFAAGWWLSNSSDMENGLAGSYHGFEPDVIIDDAAGEVREETILQSDNLSWNREASLSEKTFDAKRRDFNGSNSGGSYIFTSNGFPNSSNRQNVFNLQNGFTTQNFNEAGFLSVITEMLSSFEKKIEQSAWKDGQPYKSPGKNSAYSSFYDTGAYSQDNAHSEQESVSRWSMRAKASPLYWGNMPSSGNSSFTVAETTFSGGLLADYKLSKRFSVRGGVVYSKIKHNTEQVSVKTGNTFNASNYSIALPSGNIELTSSGNSSGFDYLTSSENLASSWPSSVTYFPHSGEFYTNASLTQNMEYLEVPIVISYKLIDSNVDVEINGGVSSNFLVKNRAGVYENGEKLYSAKTSDLRNVIYAGSIGVGFEYDLNKNLALLFEPNIKYYLNSISDNQAVDYRPFSVGLFAGFTYSFN